MHDDPSTVGGAAVQPDDFASLAAQHTRDLIVLMDTTGSIRWASPSHVAVLGRNPDEMVGHRNIEFIHPDDRERVLLALSRRVSEGVPNAIELRLIRADGSFVEVESIG